MTRLARGWSSVNATLLVEVNGYGEVLLAFFGLDFGKLTCI